MNRPPIAKAVALVILVAVAAACAAAPKTGSSPAKAPTEPSAAPQAASPAAYAPATPGAPAQPSPAPEAAPPRAPAREEPVPPPAQRTIALGRAAQEVDAAQRELDVAAGDCRNACRALGSMDRAAGRMCGLAQSDDEQRRCSEAKTRVVSARGKVRQTCGTCPDVSVDPSAPVPSR